MARQTIYDIGLHVGEDTEVYLATGHRVVAVDAAPTMIAAAEQRFGAAIRQGRLVLVHAAIAEAPGTVTFWINDTKTDWSSTDAAIAGREGLQHRAVTVAARTLADIVAEHGPAAYIKIDVEGADLAAIGSLRAEQAPPYLSCEVDTDDPEPPLQALLRLGYQRFLLLCQTDFSVVTDADLARYAEPAPETWRGTGARARIATAVRPLALATARQLPWPNQVLFRYGSSGPWGARLPDRWSSAAQMAALLARLSAQSRMTGRNLSWWYDLHAAR